VFSQSYGLDVRTSAHAPRARTKTLPELCIILAWRFRLRGGAGGRIEAAIVAGPLFAFSLHYEAKSVIIRFMNPMLSPDLAWQPVQDYLIRLGLEVAESAALSCFEPNSISCFYADELPRVRKAILRARDGKLARFRDQVSRNAFLTACGDYADAKPEEHLIIGYGSRHGSTTKVESLHHVIGSAGSVHLPDTVAHAMWDYYRQHERHELLIFHNHPYNPLNFLFDNLPLPSRQDRLFLEARAINPQQIVRALRGQGRARFYLGENGFVREFRLPSVVALLDRHVTRNRQ
jgi:hypothetical protein